MDIFRCSVSAYLVRLSIVLLALLTCVSCAEKTTAQVGNHLQTPTTAPNPTSTPNPIPEKAKIAPKITTSPNNPVKFSLEEMQKQFPKDLQRQLIYWGGGGAGDYCSESGDDGIVLCPQDSVERFRYVLITLGNLEPGSPIELTINTPDKKSQTIDLSLENDGSVAYKFIPTLDDPLGDYQVLINTPNGILSERFKVVKSDRPRLVVLPDENQIVLFGFTPFETVRVFLYSRQETGAMISLLGWQGYRVDEQGKLVLETPAEIEQLFVAIGDKSGTAYKEEAGSEWTNQDWVGGDVYCHGAMPPQGLETTQSLAVSLPEAPVRLNPSDNSIFATLNKGTILKLDGTIWYSPICQDGSFWYAVDCASLADLKCPDHGPVWMPESIGNQYALVSVESIEENTVLSSTLPAQGSIPGESTGSQPTPRQSWPVSDTGVEACHLWIGNTVHAREQARLWSLPDTTKGNILKELNLGAEALIIDGPKWGIIRNDISFYGWWWKLEVSSTGESGWLWQSRISECAGP